jgi:hypothetical protein
MQCSECKKLKLECERIALDHRELLRMREVDAPQSQPNGSEIWDFIMDMAVRKRKDAQRALADHRTRHSSILARSVAIVTVVLGQSGIWEAADFWETFGGAIAS